MNEPKHPMQPIVMVGEVARFKTNPIVRWLLDAGPYTLNDIAMLPGLTDEDHSQFAQLTGYSVSGYGDLSYAVDVETADAAAAVLIDAKEVAAAMDEKGPSNVK